MELASRFSPCVEREENKLFKSGNMSSMIYDHFCSVNKEEHLGSSHSVIILGANKSEFNYQGQISMSNMMDDKSIMYVQSQFQIYTVLDYRHYLTNSTWIFESITFIYQDEIREANVSSHFC